MEREKRGKREKREKRENEMIVLFYACVARLLCVTFQTVLERVFPIDCSEGCAWSRSSEDVRSREDDEEGGEEE